MVPFLKFMKDKLWEELSGLWVVLEALAGCSFPGVPLVRLDCMVVKRDRVLPLVVEGEDSVLFGVEV